MIRLASSSVSGAGVGGFIEGVGDDPTSRWANRLAQISIAWLLLNWWPHDSLHVFNGHNMRGLLAIEYGFHVTLMLSGIVLAAFFLRIWRSHS